MTPYHIDHTAASAISRGLRRALALGALAWSALVSADVLDYADLSMLDDFGVSNITDMVGTTDLGNLAGIQQSGSGNSASINQAGNNNNAQIWQMGDDNIANVSQAGDSNTVRLWQGGSSNIANLVQIGSNNQIAAVQYESNSVLDGRQEGVGNMAAFVLREGSNLTFLQRGDNNTIVMTVPGGSINSIEQIGNNVSASISSR